MSTTLDLSRIRFSEANAIAACEKKWSLEYREGVVYDPSPAMGLGTIMHRLCEQWWETSAWRTFYDTMHATEPYLTDDDRWETAHWLMNRYVEHYTPMWSQVKVRKHELELSAQFGDVTVVGHLDGIYEWEDKLWLIERKTMSNFEPRMSQLWVDPQLSLYYWLAQENGLDVYGIWYDAIKTYRWKTGKHPASDSFEQAFIDRTEHQVNVALTQLNSIIDRRLDLVDGGAVATYNIGPLCNGCVFRGPCFDSLGFPELRLVNREDSDASRAAS